MLDFGISWATAFTIVGAVVTITLGAIKLTQVFRFNLPKDFTEEIKKIQEENQKIRNDLTLIEATIDTEVSAKNDALKTQLNDLTQHYHNLNKKVDDLINTVIEYFSNNH